MTTNSYKAGDVLELQAPVVFGQVDANGQAVAGFAFESSVIVVLSNNGDEVYLAPATLCDNALLEGASQLYPPPAPPTVQVYDPKTGLPVYGYVGSGFEPPEVEGFEPTTDVTGGSAPNGMLLFVCTLDVPHEPPTHAVVQEFEPYLTY